MTRAQAASRFRRETAEAISRYRAKLKEIVSNNGRDFSSRWMEAAFHLEWLNLKTAFSEASRRMTERV